MSPLESSVSFWDGLAFWLTVAGATLVFFGGVSSVVFRRYNRQLLRVRAVENQRERDATAKSLAEANARAAEANARAKDAEARIAEAAQKVEEEHLARVKLEAKMADRRLTAEQKRQIKAVLSAHPGYAVIAVSRLTDTEGKTYGTDFIDAL